MRIRSGVFLLAALVAVCAAPARASDFSGTWGRIDALSQDPYAKGRDRVAPGANEDSPSTGGRPRRLTDWTEDVPLEVTVDASRLTVVDDGEAVRVTYPSGRKRVFFTDGEERELDDGDGPVRMVAKRKDAGRIVVSSKWSNKNALGETWELQASPRRLTVTTKVSARRSFTYTRVYEPAIPWTPTPTPTPTVPAPPSPTGAAGTSAASAMGPCTIHPPRGTSGQELSRLAKISLADAQKSATAAVAPARVTSVIASDVEVNEGCLVFPIDLRLEGKKGVQEVLVDAGDGRVLSSKFDAD